MYIGSLGANPTEYGGTVPAVSEPFGMTQWCAATRINGISKTMYHYDDDTLLGFMGTHQPAIWMGDYGYFTMIPQVGRLKISAEERAVPLERDTEVTSPYYYKISHRDGGQPVTTEFTATSHSSFFRIIYPANGKAILYIEAGREKEGGGVEIDPAEQEIKLFNSERHDAHLGQPLYNFAGYYVMKFSKPFAAYGTWSKGEATSGQTEEKGANVGCYVEFEPGGEPVEVRIGSSFIDYAQAAENLDREIPAGETFEQAVANVKKCWSDNMNRVEIKGASDDDLAIFYTAYFRTLQFPREMSEYGRYYSPFDEQIHDGVSYTAYSLWDTFRAEHPWLQLVQPERVNSLVQSLVNTYRESGWLPKWPNLTFTNIMIGTHADAVIADAYINGYRGYDIETAYEAIRKDAFTPPTRDEHYRWGDRDFWNGSYEARGGLTNYLANGYVASDKADESVARTLEFALDDYCIAQMANKLGLTDDYKVLMERSRNYKNLYNPSTGFFQAKKSDGTWDGADEGFTEGANWTYRFCVMQDVPGMIELMGGPEKFMSALDENFDGGHYRHDNEPGHHNVYLYDHCGRLDKVQERLPGIIEANYRNRPDGLSGNDDCGQMSAWYLFSSLGFYPLTPTSEEYALGIPRFEQITLTLPNSKQLVVKAKGLARHATLTDVRFNGHKLDRPFISTEELMQGGVLEFR
jgi:predicted alpha-1,2-mannosidase